MTEGAGEEDKKLFSEVRTAQQAAFDKTILNTEMKANLAVASK